jgi:hypothetical protein
VPPNTFLDLGPAITQAQGILAAVTTVGDHLAAIPPEPAWVTRSRGPGRAPSARRAPQRHA